MTTIISAGSPAQFLGLVPHILGFTPARSLVLVPFAGSRSLGAMRVDLPVDADDGGLDAVASTVTGMVCRVEDADGVAVIVYDEPLDGGLPHRELVGAIRRRADASGLRLVDALLCGESVWGSYLDEEQGAPLRRLDAQPVSADELPPAVGDQASGADLPEVDAADVAQVHASLAALRTALWMLCDAERDHGSRSDDHPDRADGDPPSPLGTSVRIDPRALEAACRLDDIPEFFESALEPDAVADPFRAATLVWCLARPALRDIALVQWCGAIEDGDEALDAQLRWEAGEAYPDDVAMRMWGEGPRPDGLRLRAALTAVRSAAAVAPAGDRPGALATCAWLSWALGLSTHAELYARRAIELEAEHGLSEIVLSFVGAGHLPDWAFRPAAERRVGGPLDAPGAGRAT
jgi:hypothetical protein